MRVGERLHRKIGITVQLTGREREFRHLQCGRSPGGILLDQQQRSVQHLPHRRIKPEPVRRALTAQPPLLDDGLKQLRQSGGVVEMGVGEKNRADPQRIQPHLVGGRSTAAARVKPEEFPVVLFQRPRRVATAGMGFRAGTAAENVEFHDRFSEVDDAEKFRFRTEPRSINKLSTRRTPNGLP